MTGILEFEDSVMTDQEAKELLKELQEIPRGTIPCWGEIKTRKTDIVVKSPQKK